MTQTIAVYRRDVTSYIDNANGSEYFFSPQAEEDINYRDTNLVSVRKGETELVGFFTPKEGLELEFVKANDDTIRLYVKGGSIMGYSSSDIINKVASYDGVGHYAHA